jgi:hypothetical protein
MLSSLDPTNLSPDQRFREIARLLAVGVLRLKKPVISSDSGVISTGKTFPESAPNHLDVTPEKSVTVHGG